MPRKSFVPAAVSTFPEPDPAVQSVGSVQTVPTPQNPSFPPCVNRDRPCSCKAGVLMPGHADEHEADADPRSPSSLDPLETNVHGTPMTLTVILDWAKMPPGEILRSRPELWESFRHGGWAHTRERVFEALSDTGAKPSRLVNFADCGRHAVVLENKEDPTVHRVAATCCHDRWCLPCGAMRARTVAANVAAKLAGQPARFITLTVKSDDEPLTDLLEKLFNSFKALRRTKLWKSTQRGGVAFLEVKWNEDQRRWHPHFHVLAQGRYIDHKALKAEWHRITKDSFIVDVRSVKGASDVVSYVTKYASKPFDPSMFRSPRRLREAILALAHRRMIATFGGWRGLQTTDAPTKEAWRVLGSLEDVFRRAAQGDEESITVCRQIAGERYAELLAAVRESLPPPDVPPRCATRPVQLRLTY